VLQDLKPAAAAAAAAAAQQVLVHLLLLQQSCRQLLTQQQLAAQQVVPPARPRPQVLSNTSSHAVLLRHLARLHRQLQPHFCAAARCEATAL
jgi:hypothetical protein